MTGIDAFREKLQVLVSKFERDKHHYLSKGYPEAQVRIDFLSEAINAALKKAYAGKSRTYLRLLMKEEGITEAEMLKTFKDVLGYNRK